MNPNPQAHFYKGSPSDAPGGIPAPYSRGVFPTETPSIFPGTTGIPGGGRGSLPLTNAPIVYNYAFNVNTSDGGRASALGMQEFFFTRNDAASQQQTQDPTVTWMSLSALNAHLRSTAGRMDYGAHEDGGRLAADWRFSGAQTTSKAAWEMSQRTSDVLPMCVGGRTEVFNIWLATGINPQKDMRVYLVARRERLPLVSGAEVAANPSARPIDSEGDLSMLLEDGDDDTAPGTRGYVPQNIRPGALRRDRRVGADLSYTWQIYPYVSMNNEPPHVDEYHFQGSIGFCINVGRVLWESPIEAHNAGSYASIAQAAIFPSSGGSGYKEDIKRLPLVVLLQDF